MATAISSSFGQQELKNRALSANDVTIMVGDVVVALGQTTASAINWGTDQFYGIGSPKPQDIQQLKFSPTIDIDSFALTPDGLGIFGYPSTIAEVLAGNSFEIHIMSRSGDPLLTFVGCVSSNFNLNIPANQVVTQTINFQSMDVLDALGNSIMASNSALDVGFLIGSILNGGTGGR